MTADTPPWLPADTQPPPALHRLIADAVDGWSARWFGGAAVHLTPLRRDMRGEWGWRSLDAGLMLGTSPDTALHIGARMLDVAAEDRQEPDRALLEAVAEDCLVDLRLRLAQLVGAAADAQWRPVVRADGWWAAIGEPRAPIAIAITDGLFATLVTRMLPASPAIALGSGAAALAATDVCVYAAVGRAGMSLADLRALEIGDVVVLDRPLSSPVPIAVDGHTLVRGTTRVVAADPLFLELVQAVTPA